MTGEHPYDELAVGWALHALEPDDEAGFARHLTGCGRCRRTAAETSEVMAAMARDLPSAEPSDRLRARLRAAVEETEQVRPRTVGDAPADHGERRAALHASPPPADPPRLMPVPRRSSVRRSSSALVAAASAAVLGLGVWVTVLDRSRDELQSTVAAQQEVVAELMRPGRATITPLTSADRQVATVVARNESLQVVTDGLESNDTASTTYVVWGLGEGDPVALGTFDVARSQMEVRTVGSGTTGLDDYPSYGISIEPGRQAPSSPTEVVATGEVTS